jgi:hypothetical protein
MSERTVNDENEIFHDALADAILEYYTAQEWWERKRSLRAYAAVSRAARKIKNISAERVRELRRLHHGKDDLKNSGTRRK